MIEKTILFDEVLGRRPLHVGLVGGSGVGKSTVLKHIREDRRLKDFDFPVRMVSRPTRGDDDPEENEFQPLDELDVLEKAGRLSIRWSKPLSDGNLVDYAFPRFEASAGILGLNDAFVANRKSLKDFSGISNSILLVQVLCPQEHRIERLLNRSPDLKLRQSELATRIQDDAAIVGPLVHIKLQNWPHAAKETSEALINFLCQESIA